MFFDTSYLVQCRLSNLRKGLLALSNLKVKGLRVGVGTGGGGGGRGRVACLFKILL